VEQNSGHLPYTNDQYKGSPGKVKSAAASWSSICSIAGLLIPIIYRIWLPFEGRPAFHPGIPPPLSVSVALEIIGMILGIISFVRANRIYGLIINIFALVCTTLVLGSMVIYSNSHSPKLAHIARMQISEFEQVLQVFREDTSRFPTTAEGLDALVHNPGNPNDWNGPYLKNAVPRDPWRKEYIYVSVH
jgi:general secretion pathway protein G